MNYYDNAFKNCTKGFPIVFMAMRNLLEGYDPNQGQQPEQKGSTLGKIAKYGAGALGLGALGLGGLGLYDPNALGDLGHSVGNFAKEHGMDGVGDSINNATDWAKEQAISGHNWLRDKQSELFYNTDQKEAYDNYTKEHPNEIRQTHKDSLTQGEEIKKRKDEIERKVNFNKDYNERLEQDKIAAQTGNFGEADNPNHPANKEFADQYKTKQVNLLNSQNPMSKESQDISTVPTSEQVKHSAEYTNQRDNKSAQPSAPPPVKEVTAIPAHQQIVPSPVQNSGNNTTSTPGQTQSAKEIVDNNKQPSASNVTSEQKNIAQTNAGMQRLGASVASRSFNKVGNSVINGLAKVLNNGASKFK